MSLWQSCTWKDEGIIEPELFVASDDFQIVTGFSANQDSVDFTTESVSFIGEFDEKVSWNMTILGLSSGAEREFYGESSTLENMVEWSGETDGEIENARLFSEENCRVTLKIIGYDEELSDTIFIKKTKEGGFLFSDFEEANALSTPWFTPSTVDPEDEITASIDEGFNSPQGQKSLLLTGNDVSNNFYIGNIGYNNIAAIPTGTTNADSLFFNVYVYGNGADSPVKLEFQLTENDLEKWIYQVNTTHIGWKYVSIPYSSFLKTEVSPFGNEEADPEKITLMTILLSSVPSGQEVKARIDYPILTTGKPLFK